MPTPPGWRDHFLIEYLSVGTYYNDQSPVCLLYGRLALLTSLAHIRGRAVGVAEWQRNHAAVRRPHAGWADPQSGQVCRGHRRRHRQLLLHRLDPLQLLAHAACRERNRQPRVCIFLENKGEREMVGKKRRQGGSLVLLHGWPVHADTSSTTRALPSTPRTPRAPACSSTSCTTSLLTSIRLTQGESVHRKNTYQAAFALRLGFLPLDHQLVSQCNRGAANAAAQLAGAILALQGDLIPAVQLPVTGNYVDIFSLLTPAALTPCNFSKDTPCVYIVKKKRQ